MSEIILSLIQIFLMISIFYFFSVKLIKKTSIDLNFFNFILIYHFFFTLLFYTYSVYEISDAKTVYFYASINDFHNFLERNLIVENFALGQNSMIIIVKYLIILFKFTYLSATFFFSILSLIGLLILYNLLSNYYGEKNKKEFQIISLFFYFPSLHFWQVSLSKDAIIFLCICLFILFQKDIIKYFFLGIISLSIIFLIRPYLIPFFVFFTYVNIIFENKIDKRTKYLILITSILPILYIIPFTLRYVGLDIYVLIFDPSLLFNEIWRVIYRAQEVGLSQNAGINKKELNLVSQIFIYIFGPLNIFHPNIAYKIASLENIFLLIYFGYLFFNKNLLRIDLYRIILLLIFISLLTILALRTSNYGISMRQKWMILPFLFIFLSNYFQNKNTNEN